MLLFTLLLLVAECSAYCKSVPGSSSWPSAREWQSLNVSVSGRLIQPEPPGAVCYPNRPEYDNASCQALKYQWTISSSHRDSPVSVDWNDDTCSPSLVQYSSCSSNGYPAYILAAQQVSDIQKGIKFAARTGVRLTVKGTGHDFLGSCKSSGPGSLSIWTRGLQGIEFGAGTAKIMAGMSMGDMLSAGGQRGLTMVTGVDPDVGIGGWLAGAGHGPVTAVYGMGADQVVEMEVVTAKGEFLTINEKQYPDLFWAMRGGGGSTYAIMVSATVKTYADFSVSVLNHTYTTTAESQEYWDMITTFHNYVPRLYDSGVMGYYFSYPDTSITTPESPATGTLATWFLIPNKTIAEASALLKPMEQSFRATNISTADTFLPAFSLHWSQIPREAVGQDIRYTSRLWDAQALTNPNLTATLRAAIPHSNARVFTGLMVASHKPSNNAVLPAWRTAYAHVLVGKTWTKPSDAASSCSELRTHAQALNDLAPHSGAYMSESDPADPDWQVNYFGSNYPRLLAIKKKWDPNGVFWCKPCVGSELWSVSGGDGIGQNGGLLCRVE